MDEKRDKPHFWDLLERTAAGYPNSKWSGRNAEAYWMRLQLFALEDIVAGTKSAAKASPLFMPGVELIIQGAQGAELERKTRQHREAENQAELDQVADTSHIPTDPDGVATYIAASDNEFEQLARQWEVENKQYQLRGTKMPRGAGVKRAQTIQRMLSSALADKAIP